jgi:plastocyanin domain-containing protein
MRGIVLLAVLLSTLACKREDKAEAPAVAAAPIEVKGKRVDVKADGNGFSPSSVSIKKGEATTLVFTRTTDDTCATEVVFPEIKLEKKLPLQQLVTVEVPVDQDRELAFQCGMGMYKSKVVIQ